MEGSSGTNNNHKFITPFNYKATISTERDNSNGFFLRNNQHNSSQILFATPTKVNFEENHGLQSRKSSTDYPQGQVDDDHDTIINSSDHASTSKLGVTVTRTSGNRGRKLCNYSHPPLPLNVVTKEDTIDYLSTNRNNFVDIDPSPAKNSTSIGHTNKNDVNSIMMTRSSPSWNEGYEKNIAHKQDSCLLIPYNSNDMIIQSKTKEDIEQNDEKYLRIHQNHQYDRFLEEVEDDVENPRRPLSQDFEREQIDLFERGFL